MPNVPVILASASPRRRELLSLVVPEFEVIPTDLDEPDDLPEPLEASVQDLALAKARVAAATRPEALVIGADTIVVLDGQVMGKPRAEDDARRMLSALSGRSHNVMTGVAVVWGDISTSACETTEVRFGPMSPEHIDRYIASGEPFDKAGAYGIQGGASLFVEGINGCYFNVVGLPVYRLNKLLEGARALASEQGEDA